MTSSSSSSTCCGSTSTSTSSSSRRAWAKLISLDPERPDISLNSESDFLVPEKWMMRQDEDGNTWITNLSDSLLQIDEDTYLAKDETGQVFGGERIAFEIVEIKDNQRFDYCIALIHMPKRNPLKREREETPSSKSKSESKEETKKLLKTYENFFKSLACAVCSQIDEKCVLVNPCMHNFCPSCLLDSLIAAKSGICPALGCGQELKFVSKNKIVQDGFLLFKDDLKKSSKECSIKLERDLEGAISVDQKGVFVGSMSRKMSTYGIKLFFDGILYQGNWACTEMSGQGIMTMPNGWCFKGDWSGYGLSNAEISVDGVTFYKGEIKNWELHGKGVYTSSNGDVYDGEFVQGKKNGTGKMKYVDGNVYTGAWKNDVREGKGIMEYANKEFYKGDWKGDMRNGLGTLIFLDETKYRGYWKDDQRDGEGALIMKNGDRFEGVWVNNQMQGEKVTISYSNKDEYTGEIDVEKLQRNGKGTLLRANDDKYVGQWKDDKQHGYGKEICKEDQSSFEGNWQKGKQVEGTLTTSDGEKYEFKLKKIDVTKTRRNSLPAKKSLCLI